MEQEQGMSRSTMHDIVPLAVTLHAVAEIGSKNPAEALQAVGLVFSELSARALVADDRNAESVHQLIAQIHDFVHRLIQPDSPDLAQLRAVERDQHAQQQGPPFIAPQSKEVH